MEIENKINEIILDVLSDQISEEDLTPDKRLVEDFGAASMQLLEIMLIVSAEFAVQFPKEEAVDIRTLGDLYAFVAEKKGVELLS